MTWPKTLFGRNVLLIVGLMTLAQIGSALAVRELIIRPRADLIADALARNIGGLRAGLMKLPPEQRGAFVDEFNRRGLQGARDSAGDDPTRRPLTLMERRFVRQVSQRIAADGAEIYWRREAGGSLAVRLSIEAGSYWITLPGVLPAREFTGAWIFASLTGALLALVGAYAIQRRLNRPLARVVAAAGDLARGVPPTPLPEDGPTETATLAASFNRLVDSLQRTERERALMLAGISHDMRTPLAKLRLGVEIVHERIEPELAASMTRSVEEMDAIVGQFLDFARDAADEPLAAGDLDALARDIAAAFADHGQSVALELGAPDALRVRPQSLRRAVVNLVENAYRHGRAPVRLRTGQQRDAAWIEVLDDGDGIAPAEVEALRQPFRRASHARSGAAGAGLGLAIVERVARQHGGRLELAPAQPRGWRARLVLPRSA